MIPAGIFVVCMALNYGLTYAATFQDGEHYERLLEYGNPLLALAAAMAFLMLVRLKRANSIRPNRRRSGLTDFVDVPLEFI